MQQRVRLFEHPIPKGTPPIRNPIQRAAAKLLNEYDVEELPESVEFTLADGWVVAIMCMPDGTLLLTTQHQNGQQVIAQRVPCHRRELPPVECALLMTTDGIQQVQYDYIHPSS